MQPETIDALIKIRGITDKVVNYHGKELCALIKTAKTAPPLPMPIQTKNTSVKDPQQEALIDILFALVRIRAEENSLNPTILATRQDLDSLLNGDDEASLLLCGWRFSMVGKELQQLLRGEVLLKVEGGNLQFIS